MRPLITCSNASGASTLLAAGLSTRRAGAPLITGTRGDSLSYVQGKDRVKKRVVVGMSGGVDSSVAALLMRDEGHEVLGVTMSIYSGKPANGPVPDSCYGPGEPGDIEQARQVCAGLGIPHQVIDLRTDYRSLVLDYARDEYLGG